MALACSHGGGPTEVPQQLLTSALARRPHVEEAHAMQRVEPILSYWFGSLADDYDVGANAALWWKKDEQVDEHIRATFGADVDKAINGDYDDWQDAPRACLALVILLDQFSRNIFRGSPRAWEQDPQALDVALRAIDRGLDHDLRMVERQFLTMPLMHAEDVGLHRRLGLLIDEALAEIPVDRREPFLPWKDAAAKHAAIVERFGRYPHRNAVIGRASSAEELAFLEQPGSSF